MTDEQQATEKQPAGFWLRALAKLVDRLVLLLAGILLTALAALLHAAGFSGLIAFGFWAASLLLLEIVYFAVLTSHGRQTIGYRLAGVRVFTLDGRPTGVWRCLARAVLNSLAWAAASIGIGLVDYLFVAFPRSKRALHDRATGTQVLRVAPARKTGLVIVPLLLGAMLWLAMPSIHRLMQAFYVASGAMADTLVTNDRLLANTLYYRLQSPRHGDIVMFEAPAGAGTPPGTTFVKRCVGVPGDTVFVRERKLYRNGALLAEPYAKWNESEHSSYGYDMKVVDGVIYSREYEAPGLAGLWSVNGEPVMPGDQQQRIEQAKPGAVPPGQFIMLGDWRNNSNDSHIWGFVPQANLIGKAMVIYAPIGRIRGL